MFYVDGKFLNKDPNSVKLTFLMCLSSRGSILFSLPVKKIKQVTKHINNAIKEINAINA